MSDRGSTSTTPTTPIGTDGMDDEGDEEDIQISDEANDDTFKRKTLEATEVCQVAPEISRGVLAHH